MKKISAIRITTIIIFVIAVLSIGTFFDWAVAISGLAIMAGLIVVQKKNHISKVRMHWLNILPLGILIWGLLCTIWAVDRVDNILGVLRLLVLVLWMIYMRSVDEADRRAALDIIPHIGCGITIVALAVKPFVSQTGFFWENSRLSFVFQYANADALFLALGLIILVRGFDGKKKALFLAEMIILLTGLFFTGSRSVLLLLILYFVYLAIREKRYRKLIFAGLGVVILAAVAMFFFTDSTRNITRIFTIFTSSSTLWGRVLYMKDALVMLIHRPFGYGYMGYSYGVGLYQTGVYTVRFVHNDILQLALDFGIPALVAVSIIVVRQLINKKLSVLYKELILFICISAFFDFCMQLLIFPMIALICFSYDEECEPIKKRVDVIEAYIYMGIVSAILLYFGIATMACYLGNYSLSRELLPDHTASGVNELTACTDKEQAKRLCDRIISNNKYCADAYVYRAYYYLMTGELDALINDMDMAERLRPYSSGIYDTYEQMLNTGIISVQNSYLGADGKLPDFAEKEIKTLQERIEKLDLDKQAVLERTSPIAYKLNDKPDLYKEQK